MTATLDQQLLPKFEKQTGVRVIHKNVQMTQDDLARIMVGQGPDVLVTWNLNMETLLRANLLVELTPYFNRWDGRQSFFPTLSTASCLPYPLHILPIEISPFGIGYIKGAFSAAGLDPETPPRGWEELESG